MVAIRLYIILKLGSLSAQHYSHKHSCHSRLGVNLSFDAMTSFERFKQEQVESSASPGLESPESPFCSTAQLDVNRYCRDSGRWPSRQVQPALGEGSYTSAGAG